MPLNVNELQTNLNPIQIEMARTFLANPEVAMTVQEWAETWGISKGYAHLCLTKLMKAEIIQRKKVGRKHYYYAKADGLE